MIAALTLTFASLASVPAQDWKRVEPDLRLDFPRDHASHPDHRTEWWYLTGHLEDEQGSEYGFQFTVFRHGLDPHPPRAGDSALRARQVLAGHMAVADLERQSFRFAERLRRTGPLAWALEERLELQLEDWNLRLDDEGALHIAARDPALGIGLDLELLPTKALVLHGAGGYSRKGLEPGNASAYSSWTRLVVTGSIDVEGQARRVQGEAWYDHEFGSSQLGPGVAGWDWFSLQLEDGRELMLYGLRSEDDSGSPYAAGTLVERDGKPTALAPSDFVIEAAGNWTSPHSGAVYPAGWRIRVPAHGLELDLAPRLDDCELDTKASTGVIYWEGPVAVTGSGRGRGYVELVGYAGSQAGRF